MIKAVYKITNLINKKVYIGQSNNPHERWKYHIYGYGDSKNSLIHNAIKKYGVQNFSFEILGYFENYNEQEQYYIQHFRSIAPYGYNIQSGGEEPPHPHGEQHPNATITQEEAKKIQQQMLNWNLTEQQIIKSNKITKNIFRHIREGNSWYDPSLKYPLRPTEAELNEIKADKVIKLLKTTRLSQKEIGQRVGWNRSAVTMINIGKNHHRDNENYPIRK